MTGGESTAAVLQTRAGRRPLPVLYLPVVVLASLAYAALASLNPVINQSALGIALLTLLFLIVNSFILMNVNGDALDPFRVMSVYYLMCFCITPLFIVDPEWHYTAPHGPLVAKSAAFLIVGYLMMAVGYYLPIFRPIPRLIHIGRLRANPMLFRILALSLFVIGQICLVIVFFRAGGIGTILGSDVGRNVFFKGLGIFLWPALFSFSGGILYFASRARHDVPLPWIHSWPLWITAASWIIFQSRMKVLNLLVMGLLVGHYLIRPIRMTRVVLFGAAGFAFAVVVGFGRQTDTRHLLITNPEAMLLALFEHFWEFSHAILVGSFSRLRQIMLIFDKVPSWTPHDWGASFLLIFNPVLRLVGLDHLQVQGIGPRLFDLAHPQLEIDLETGYLPSLPGEFLFNFPPYLAIFMFPLYGMALRAIYSRLILRNADPSSVALYAILLLALVNMIFASCGQNLFELLVLSLPPLVAIKVAEMAAPRPAGGLTGVGLERRPGGY